MKLLVVTGIVNSSCLPIYSALNSPMKKLADIVPNYAELLQKLLKQKNEITTQSLHAALGIEEDESDYIVCDENQLFNLSQWAAFPQLTIVVFYSSPANALANALLQNELSLDECNEFMAEWAKQINDTFRFYQQHKDICLLLDSDDVNKHSKLASELISGCVDKDVRLGNVSNNPSTDTLLAANLILSEQDHLFEVYDEVRSSAPIFENFTLSGTADYQSLAIDSLKSINTNRTAKVELNGKVSKLEQQDAALNEKVAQVTQQLTESQTAVDEANKKHQTEMAAAEQQKAALNEKVAQVTQQLSESQTAVDEANKKHQTEMTAAEQQKAALNEKVAQVTQQLSESQTAVDEANKKHQTEMAAAEQQRAALNEKVAQVTQQLSASRTTVDEANKKHQTEMAAAEQQRAALNEKVAQVTQQLSESQTAVDEANKKHQTEMTAAEQQKAALNEKVAQVTQQLSESQTAVDEANKKHQTEMATAEQQKSALNEKVAQVTQQLSESQTAVDEANKKHQTEMTAAEQQKAALNEKVAQVTQHLSESQTAVDEANKKHQTEMATAEQQKSALNEKVAQVTQQLSESQTAVDEANKKHHAELAKLQNEIKQSDADAHEIKKLYGELENENELLFLQVVQLLEELEATVEKNSIELRKVQEALKTREAELESSTTRWDDLSQSHKASTLADRQTRDELQSKNSLLAAQIVELKKELEMQKMTFAEFVSKAEALNAKQQFDKNSNEKKYTDCVTKLTHLTEENELCILQILQLQEELEVLSQSKQELEQKNKKNINSQRNEQVQLEDKASQAHQQMQATVAENEVAILQINQLQEELEFYYQQLQEKESQKLLTQFTNEQACQNVFEQTTIDSFDIIGSYEIPGYQDIQLLLNNVKFANGNYLEKLHVKLVEISGKPGIEFRPSEVSDESVNLHWREDMQDEFGSFIRFIPNPNSEQQALQQKTNESLCASDRLIVLSIASKLADVLQMTTDSDLPEGKLRDWKLIAISLKHQVAQLPNWMSFDALSLVEEMRTDNYEHLWLRFNNLLVNDHLRPEFEVKFAVTDLTSDGDLFSTKLMLEIRQQDNQQSPLQAWPPVSQDGYGYKLQAFVNLNEDKLVISVEEKLSIDDYQFLHHLVKNLVNFLQALTGQGHDLDRPIADWLAIGSRIVSMGLVKSGDTQDTAMTLDSEDDDIPKLNLLFNEHVDLGGYKHLLYQHALSDNELLLIKIRAENINQDAKTAELSVELRTGDENIPLSDSEFFGEDEFGPRVLIPIGFLQNGVNKQEIVSDEMRLLLLFIEQIKSLVEDNIELDEVQRALWLAMLSNK